MRNEIKIVNGSYAAVNNNVVIGIVEPFGGGWRFAPIVMGTGNLCNPVPLSHALKQATDFEIAK